MILLLYNEASSSQFLLHLVTANGAENNRSRRKEAAFEIIHRKSTTSHSRVPVKSLMQFQSVCKLWKSLITDSKFAKKHLRVSTTRHHLLFRRLTKNEFVINTCPLSSIFTTRKVIPAATATQQLEHSFKDGWYDEIRGSCHGILCIQLEGSDLILWNPSIRKFTRLPSLEIPGNNSTYSSFGYDHSTDSYKVVACSCIKRDNGVYEVKTFVHTVGTNFWRRIQADFPSIYDNQLGQFVSGTLNWLPYRHSSIVSLDFENESYRQLLLPVSTSSSKSLCVVKECLCILVHMGLHSDVWLMKDYGNQDSWTKLFRVPVPNMRGVGLFPYLKALYVYEDDQVLLKLKSKLVVYNSTDWYF